MTRVSRTIQKQVTDRIKSDMAVLNAHYGTTHPIPTVAYDVRGCNGGYVSSADGWNVIHLNPILLNENIDEVVNQTTPHELAHYMDIKVNGVHTRGRNGRRSVHGQSWKIIMGLLGVDPERCHSMDTTNAAVRTKNKHEYKCNCGAILIFSSVRHNKMIRKQAVYCHKLCGSRSTLTYVRPLGQVTITEARQNRSSHKRPTTGQSKKERAQAIYDKWSHTDRALIIARFRSELDMTKAGATTYFYNVTK